MRQDGRSASLTAPNGRAQHRLLSAVLADASTTPAQLQLVEAAANGSALGDPIEAGAIVTAVLVPRARTGTLLAGSVKANVGHTESASGMIGLSKLLCAMRCTQAPPNAQLAVLAVHVVSAWESAPASCALPSQLTATPTRLVDGTVSSFGLGGTLASAVLRKQVLSQDGVYATAGYTYRRRSFLWRRPMRVHVKRRGANQRAARR